MHKNIKKWVGFQFSTGSYAAEDYKQFQRGMRTDLRCQAKEIRLELHSFHPNHYMFAAVLKNPENNRFVYISIPDVRYWQDQWTNHVLYRTMKNPTDWTGGGNHFGDWDKIGELAYGLVS